MKPQKTIYKNQGEIQKKFIEFIQPFLQKYPEIKEAYLEGSLAKGNFGLYEKEYKGHTGSDVDLVLVIDGKIPSNWKNLEATHPEMKLYKDNEFRKFCYQKNIHKIDLNIYNKKISKKNFIKLK